jgi:hypothetical protein
MWDASWLTLLSRARKNKVFDSDFDWKTFTPFLLSKTKELLQLPGAAFCK